MMTRSRASLCSLLLLWVFALGAGPARHVAPQPLVLRSAVELALRDVAESPLLAARSEAPHVTAARIGDRDAPSHLSTAPGRVERMATIAAVSATQVRTTLLLQDDAHCDRPRWRAYDAAAPPARSPTTR